MSMNIANAEHIDSYYAATANDHTRYPRLTGRLDADVVVVGGGLTGISAALNLAERGFSVVVLEAGRIGWAASGRNGGQMIAGFACGMDTFAADLPDEDVKRVWDMGIESINIIRERVAKHNIKCDLADGYLTAANKPKHVTELKAWRDEAASRFGFHDFEYVEPQDMHRFIASDRYLGGLNDKISGHLHPLNYNLGLARAAVTAGVRIFESSCATSLQQGQSNIVKTEQGEVHAKFAVLACNAFIHTLSPALDRKIMPVGTYVITTEPIEQERFAKLMPANAAICDSRFALDYFRPTADRRILWGGKVSYSKLAPPNLAQAMRADMLKTFPQLEDIKVSHAWGGFVDITMTRAPHFGRLSNTVYFAQGFSGHGVNVTGLAGKLMAEAIAGQAERFDIFTRLKHRDFPGGSLLRMPSLVLAMAWFRLKDLV
ncbi:NAD(P)/FAD-dependent oxidoreductase [Silvimonas soli]|uniref:NAD(P)/FAD-dependent oxidoreductase n=1 Tax=Silvimonas soli TaxID=2980100 RepID=UPI0024B32933|nr:FAD-binding oxidoreductase [Silvimonas soli]